MSSLRIINPDVDFWDLYPDLKFISEFEYIRKEYKTKSSTVMWFIVLCYHLDSKFFELEFDDRVELLSKDYLKDKNWFKENKHKLVDATERFLKFDTTVERQMRQLINTMQKRTKFLENLEYDLDNFEKHDKMVANTASLFKVFEIIEKQLNKEKGGGSTKGGHELSLSDQNDL